MPIQLTADIVRKIFPKAPQGVVDAFAARQAVLDRAGITHTRTRLAIALANVDHECNGFQIPNLTESSNYSPGRAVQIWPSRFKTVPDVFSKIGSWDGDPDFGKKLFNCVYGGRMGNRVDTDDGFNFRGRGGVQITGRDGYAKMGELTGLSLVIHPELAARHENQPDILAGFWRWKNMNAPADAGNLRECRRRWNGGYIGMADVEARYRRILALVKELPGDPVGAPNNPPQAVIDAATAKERGTRNAGAAGTLAAGTEAASNTVKEPLVSPMATYIAIGICVAIVVIAVLAIRRKSRAVVEHWV